MSEIISDGNSGRQRVKIANFYTSIVIAFYATPELVETHLSLLERGTVVALSTDTQWTGFL